MLAAGDVDRWDDPDVAWARYEPSATRPWDLRLAGHLYRRAGFGATWDELQQALADGPQRTVDRLLRPETDVAGFNQQYDAYDEVASRSGSPEGLRAWWLRRMIDTPHPLLEKMTLFWHSHFAASHARVGSTQLMAEHVHMLRRYALGRYRPLVEAASRDPAMFLGLDSAANRKAVPNTNFARRLMEQFTLGPGEFDERDVREAARALTGWFVRRGRLQFVPREHDEGPKTILGKTGNWNAQDVVDIVLGQPSVARLLVRKLYRWLISETDAPDDRLIQPLVESLDRDYDIGRVVETMLRSNRFFSPAAYRRRVKSPVEYAVGIVRAFEGNVSTITLGNHLARLGQSLLVPPTVHGWQGGRDWINRATVVGRSNLAFALLDTNGPYANKLDPATVAARHGRAEPARAGRFAVDLLLQGDIDAGVCQALWKQLDAAGDDRASWMRRFVYTLVTLPEFQLC